MQHAGDSRRIHDAVEVIDSGIPPQSAIEPEECEDDDAQDRVPRRSLVEGGEKDGKGLVDVIDVAADLIADNQSQIISKIDRENVEHNNPEAVSEA